MALAQRPGWSAMGVGALARMYASGNDEAMELYEPLIQQESEQRRLCNWNWIMHSR